ncbi:extracellular solute-binding protein [Paenibacillus ginsengarvi]|uniref:Extracellular solute-binding protein n=1 Tax=Paenibacillus ginsengarvi TaxID=400777 RepID=A0A3B0BGQ0_9BACL|nr:extracellular solute-binding protein [Paenibacillus ginsengarvi]RKN71832.1 extracellular solute-binding protein [Paenibacillus ginsengarvi]
MAVGKDYLIGIPYTRNFSALYYNKTIFDKFGVAYPKEGMTWSEYADVAKRVTRTEGGIQYRGLEPNVPKRVGAQLSLPLVDPKTNRAALNTEQWKKVLTQMTDIYKIPGNEKMAFPGRWGKTVLQGADAGYVCRRQLAYEHEHEPVSGILGHRFVSGMAGSPTRGNGNRRASDAAGFHQQT